MLKNIRITIFLNLVRKIRSSVYVRKYNIPQKFSEYDELNFGIKCSKIFGFDSKRSLKILGIVDLQAEAIE